MKTVYRIMSIGAFTLIGGCIRTDSTIQATERHDTASVNATKDFDAYCSELAEQMIKPFRSAMSIEKKIFELNAQVARGEITEKQFDLVAAQIGIGKADHKYWSERWRDSGCVTRLPGGSTNLVLSK
jgi:hypothetical protein